MTKDEFEPELYDFKPYTEGSNIDLITLLRETGFGFHKGINMTTEERLLWFIIKDTNWSLRPCEASNKDLAKAINVDEISIRRGLNHLRKLSIIHSWRPSFVKRFMALNIDTLLSSK